MRGWYIGEIVGLVSAVAVAVAYVTLVPGEAHRPVPRTIANPVLTPLAVPFTHSWARKTSHPLLAAAAIDIDGDGRDEVFLGGSDGQTDALIAWRDGALTDIAAETGIGDQEATYGALSLDLDGDGDIDLLTAGNSGLAAWINDGAKFQGKGLDIAIPAEAVPLALTAGDFDHDGDADLYVSLYVAPASFRSPVFNDPSQAKRNLLLRNDGDLTFEDVTDEVTGGLQNTFTSSFVDLDQDGWLDLVLAQNTGEVELLRNRGNGTFQRGDFHSGYGFWMGLAFGDIEADGDLDIFFSNIGNSIPAPLVTGDRRNDQRPNNEWLLLRNDGGFRFTDITEAAGLSGFGFGWGGAFEDVNLDGAPDLLVAQNYLKWPVHKIFKLPGKMLLGDGGTAPQFYTSEAGENENYGQVPLIADLDGDGRNDILWANMDGAAQVFLNRTEGNFVSVRLPDHPRSIGARLHLEGVEGPVQTLIAGEGLTSDRSTQFVFALPGEAPAPPTVVISWPDGQVTRVEAILNEPMTVEVP